MLIHWSIPLKVSRLSLWFVVRVTRSQLLVDGREERQVSTKEDDERLSKEAEVVTVIYN